MSAQLVIFSGVKLIADLLKGRPEEMQRGSITI